MNQTAILRLFHLTDGFNLGKKAFRIIELIHLFAKKREELPFYLNLVCVHLDRTKCIPLFPFSQVSFLLFWKSTCDYAINSLKLGGPLKKLFSFLPLYILGNFKDIFVTDRRISIFLPIVCAFLTNELVCLPFYFYLPFS